MAIPGHLVEDGLEHVHRDHVHARFDQAAGQQAALAERVPAVGVARAWARRRVECGLRRVLSRGSACAREPRQKPACGSRPRRGTPGAVERGRVTRRGGIVRDVERLERRTQRTRRTGRAAHRPPCPRSGQGPQAGGGRFGRSNLAPPNPRAGAPRPIGRAAGLEELVTGLVDRRRVVVQRSDQGERSIRSAIRASARRSGSRARPSRRSSGTARGSRRGHRAWGPRSRAGSARPRASAGSPPGRNRHDPPRASAPRESPSTRQSTNQFKKSRRVTPRARLRDPLAHCEHRRPPPLVSQHEPTIQSRRRLTYIDGNARDRCHGIIDR